MWRANCVPFLFCQREREIYARRPCIVLQRGGLCQGSLGSLVLFCHRSACNRSVTVVHAYIWRALMQEVGQSAPVVPSVQEISMHFSGVFSGKVPAPTPSLAPPTEDELQVLFGWEEVAAAFKFVQHLVVMGSLFKHCVHTLLDSWCKSF